MNKGQWLPKSFQILEDFFSQNGYHFLQIGNQFRKETKGGWQNVILGFGHYEDCTYVEVSFGSRLNIVEQLIAPYSHGLRGYQAESNTTITNLAKFQKEAHLRFEIRDEADLFRMAAHLRDFFRKEGFAFLDSLSNIGELDKLFNQDPTNACLVSFNHQLRSFRALAIASLNQNPNWEELAEYYRGLLDKYSSPRVVIDRFNDFSHYLATTALN